MAVLKSFELNGNKQSFANWISNLSPCDTPFTSMIGKEGIDEVQYSWQTDRLAPADNASYEEGSQAVSQTRATTSVITNFTSTLRKVVQVTDAAAAVSTHGRGSELAYQMSKAGKEIMRDLEWMNLSNLNGNPGTKALASKFAGFEGLVAGVGVHDDDTGAIIHKTIEVSGTTQTRMEKKDLFDMTYNLYLAGSRADKIMFHPKHASAFTVFMNDNPEEPHTYRMFDGMSSVYNSFVKKIRDPLGRVYTLIPNRNMPEDKMYFFHEADWTQMILRQPKTTRLMKDSSSERLLLEMEVGLRHRHPYASGVLTLSTVDVRNTFDPARAVLTAAVGDFEDVTCQVLVDGVAEAGLDVHWFSDDPCITFMTPTTKTNVMGVSDNRMLPGNKQGVASVWTVCRGVKSGIHLISVAAPRLVLAVDNLNPGVSKRIVINVAVTDVRGRPAVDGTVVKWYVSPPRNLELLSISSTTISGVASVSALVLSEDPTVVQGSVGNFDSNADVLNYIPIIGRLVDFTLTPNTMAIGGFSDLSIKVLNDRDIPMANMAVNWVSSDPAIAQPVTSTSVTDADGLAIVALEGKSKGTGNIEASAGLFFSPKLNFFVGQNASLDFVIKPDPATAHEDTHFYGSVKGQDGKGISDLQFVIEGDVGVPPMRLDVTTDEDGEFDETYVFTSNSDQVITVQIPSLGINRTESLIVN